MYLLNQVHGLEQIRFTRAGRSAPLIHAADRSSFTQDDRAAG
jgi:hypothetical protein